MASRIKTPKTAPIVAEICLYGTHAIGVGYLTKIAGRPGLLGTGEPVAGVGYTTAVWNAADEIRRLGVSGTVRIFAAGGQRMADVDLGRIGYFGDLPFVPAVVVEIPVAAILEAATRQAAETAA